MVAGGWLKSAQKKKKNCNCPEANQLRWTLLIESIAVVSQAVAKPVSAWLAGCLDVMSRWCVGGTSGVLHAIDFFFRLLLLELFFLLFLFLFFFFFFPKPPLLCPSLSPAHVCTKVPDLVARASQSWPAVGGRHLPDGPQLAPGPTGDQLFPPCRGPQPSALSPQLQLAPAVSNPIPNPSDRPTNRPTNRHSPDAVLRSTRTELEH